MAMSIPTIKPSMAWLFLFFPALGYYMTTRLHSMGLFRSSTYGTIVETTLSNMRCTPNEANALLYMTSECTQLKYPVYLVDESFHDIVATTWKHDEELGRGYLLLSTSFEQGKVWQWETGGGPIAIGRTLNLQDSGCRSNLYRNCTNGENVGSGGIAVDIWNEPPRLIVAEWGEGRISRLEANGARTPMIIQLPESLQATVLNGTNLAARVNQPSKLLMSPLGDLLFLDSFGSEHCLMRLPQAATGVTPLESLAASRKAHSWEHVANTDHLPQLLLQSPHLGGIALEPNEWLRIYVTMRQNDLIVVARLSLEEVETSDNDGASGIQPQQSSIVLDYSDYTSEPRAIEVDDKGNLYLAVDDGILFVSSSGEVLGKLSIAESPIVDLTLGEDKFLYISTASKLMRMRVRNAPLSVPTNLLMKA